jgi:hypothetical protein
VLNRRFDVQVLEMDLFVRDDDVGVNDALQAMVVIDSRQLASGGR